MSVLERRRARPPACGEPGPPQPGLPASGSCMHGAVVVATVHRGRPVADPLTIVEHTIATTQPTRENRIYQRASVSDADPAAPRRPTRV